MQTCSPLSREKGEVDAGIEAQRETMMQISRGAIIDCIAAHFDRIDEYEMVCFPWQCMLLLIAPVEDE